MTKESFTSTSTGSPTPRVRAMQHHHLIYTSATEPAANYVAGVDDVATWPNRTIYALLQTPPENPCLPRGGKLCQLGVFLVSTQSEA